jgi:AcrR family transcriptional regulator
MKDSGIPSGRQEPLASSTGTRERLLKSATLELVAQKGSVELADVTRRAGVSAGAPYHHFGSKSGLIAAVVDDFYERYDKSVMDVEFEGVRWIDREELRVQGMVEFHYNEPLAPIVLSKLDRDPAIAQVEALVGCRGISRKVRAISARHNATATFHVISIRSSLRQ